MLLRAASLRTVHRTFALQRAGCASSSSSAEKPGKLRLLVREYGAVGVGTYISVYLSTLASLYAAIESGVVPAADAIGLLRRIGADRFIDLDKLSPKAGSFAIAWIMAKFTEPLRAALVFAITPRIARLVKGSRLAAILGAGWASLRGQPP